MGLQQRLAHPPQPSSFLQSLPLSGEIPLFLLFLGVLFRGSPAASLAAWLQLEPYHLSSSFPIFTDQNSQ